jgi:phage shock protein PspC (stress-responsive transcriptional regulator)
MSSPYQPQVPKRLERSKSNRVLGGVCAGVANYLNMDPTLVRVLTVVISLFTGVPVILYIIALFLMPEEGSQPASPIYPGVAGPQGQTTGFPQAPQRAQPAYPPPAGSAPTQPASAAGSASADDSIWGSEGAPWEQRQPHPEPTAPQPEPVASEPQPVGPSEPEAPIVPPHAHEEDATESAPEPEGPQERPAEEAQNAPAAGAAAPESDQASEGGQQTDRT